MLIFTVTDAWAGTGAATAAKTRAAAILSDLASIRTMGAYSSSS
jgi:hypothetical protein